MPTDANEFQASYIRHFSALATGSILLITVFLEKLFPQPKWKVLVAVALIAFLVSVIAGAAAYSILAVFDINDDEAPFHLGESSIVVMWVSFLIGVTALAAFALKNLF